MIELKDGAIFVADVHYHLGVREEFEKFLREFDSDQLVLMGDIFDLLVGEVEYTIKQNQKIIDLLNDLSQKIPIIYMEGNHDFQLKKLFPAILVVPIQKQPLILKYNSKKIALAHGDNFESKSYNFYSNIIRNRYLLKILNFIDLISSNGISKKILFEQKKKKFCKKNKYFKKFAKQKLKIYDIATNRFDLICEGHYHIDATFEFESMKYKFFASYACDGSYYKLMNNSEEIVFNHLKD
ncbi:MAG: hypothetical protein DSZ06_00235 [Sulfurospirillum sp.]|nr:MAG: hypothetical protein DSZ06_00235 [Sulfurospirillum sp.]